MDKDRTLERISRVEFEILDQSKEVHIGTHTEKHNVHLLRTLWGKEEEEESAEIME